MDFLIQLIDTLPAALLFAAGAVFGGLLAHLYQEVKHYGQMTQAELLRWENGQLLAHLERQLQDGAVARQHGSEGSQSFRCDRSK